MIYSQAFRLATAAALAITTFATVMTVAAQDSANSDSTKQEDRPLPLQLERTVSIDTDEGTWISLDVSPDGRTIVFDLLGDLYTVPLEGGEATQLTDGIAFDRHPRYSPDGSKVLFVSDQSGSDNLWTVDLATGDSTQLTKSTSHVFLSPEWSPDGKYVVASRADSRLTPAKLWIGHVDGGSGAEIVKTPDNVKALGAAFTSDGRHIWYARRAGSWAYNAMLPQYQLEAYDRETGERYTRTSRVGSGFRPTLSPDGRWLVYGTRHDNHTGLRIRDLQTDDERWLAYPVQHDDQESVADMDVLPGMSFTPDSKELVTTYGGRIWRIPINGSDPVPVPFRVRTELEIGPKVDFDYPIEDTPEFTVREIRDAVPSPDGTRLAFSAMSRLYVMDWPGGEPRRLTNAVVTEASPTWSPDGEWISYAAWSDGSGSLHKVRSDGRGAPQRLTTMDGIYQDPAWSIDGSRIAAIRGPARAYREATGPVASGAGEDIIWVSSDGGEIHLVAPAEGRSNPHFSSERDRIYLFHSSNGLSSVRWDGTDEKVHVKVTGHKRPHADNPNRPSLILKAPSGDRALALVDNQIYSLTIPYIGGDPPTISVAQPDNAPFPVSQLSDIGGHFPAWSADATKVHWSVGNAHVVYDLDAAKQFADSLKTARKAESKAAASDSTDVEKDAEGDAEQRQEEQGNSAEGGAESEDTTGRKDDETEPTYAPKEHRILIETKRDIPRGTIVLRGATLITMDGDKIIEDADLVVRDNRIHALAERGTLDMPADARIVDVTGKTIVPGFVDTHAHMRPAWGIHKEQAWQFLANLAYGVTTTRDPQTGTTDVLTYGDRVTAGDMIGPRVYSTGPGIFGDYISAPIKDLDHARKTLKRYADYYDTKTIKMYLAGTRQKRQWIIMAAKDEGIMPTTEAGLRFGYDMTMIMDGYPGQEHSWPVYPVYKDLITLTAESQMTYTPTLLVAFGGPFTENYFFEHDNPHDDLKLRRFTPHSTIDQTTRRRGQWFLPEEYVHEDHGAALKEVVEAGGKIGVGSHGQLQGLGYHWEMWSMAAGGMTNHDVLRAATIMGSEAIGLDQDLGSLAPGKLADLVVLDANPLDDLRNTNTIRLVMMNGRLYEGDTLKEIWPRERDLELPPYWQDDPVNVPAGISTTVDR